MTLDHCAGDVGHRSQTTTKVKHGLEAQADADGSHVSFVVIAHDEAPNIARTVHSILGQQPPFSGEVIVVDDGSTDGTDQIVMSIAESHPQVRLVRLPVNRGRGFARHRGVQEASAELVAFIDADIEIEPDWLSRCQEALGDPTVAAVAGVAVPDGDVAFLFSRLNLKPRRVAHTTTITGSNALFRRDVFDQVSFDPALRSGEDIALGHALREGQLATRSVDGVTVLHHERRSSFGAAAWMFESGVAASRQWRRYREVRVPDVTLLGFVLTAAAATARRGAQRELRLAAPVVYTFGAAAAHVSLKFVPERGRRVTYAQAIALDALMLMCYFAGRLYGAASFVLWRR